MGHIIDKLKKTIKTQRIIVIEIVIHKHCRRFRILFKRQSIKHKQTLPKLIVLFPCVIKRIRVSVVMYVLF